MPGTELDSWLRTGMAQISNTLTPRRVAALIPGLHAPETWVLSLVEPSTRQILVPNQDAKTRLASLSSGASGELALSDKELSDAIDAAAAAASPSLKSITEPAHDNSIGYSLVSDPAAQIKAEKEHLARVKEIAELRIAADSLRSEIDSLKSQVS
jgi:hypothetical protein